jgi:hypothetical protein
MATTNKANPITTASIIATGRPLPPLSTSVS